MAVVSVRDRGEVRALRLRETPGRLLSDRQAQVARAYASGHAAVAIADGLGLAQSTVATYVTQAAAKMGLDLAGLRYLLPASALPPTLEAALEGPIPCPRGTSWDGRDLSFPLPAAELPASLTAAEADVARLAAQGKSNADIALARRSSPRTVANQLSSAFLKLGVEGRYALRPNPALGRLAAGGGR